MKKNMMIKEEENNSVTWLKKYLKKPCDELILKDLIKTKQTKKNTKKS